VLKEVGEALLVVFLHEGAGVDIKAGADFLRGLGVGEDGVAESIGEAAVDDGGVGLEVAAVLRPDGGGVGVEGLGFVSGGPGILGGEAGGEAGEGEEEAAAAAAAAAATAPPERGQGAPPPAPGP
jgi:hypothetical protein